LNSRREVIIAIAAGLNLNSTELFASGSTHKEEAPMKPCPECGSKDIYLYKSYFPNPGGAGGETLLPDLGSFGTAASIRPLVCHSCGYIRVFASEEARERLKTAKDWTVVKG
jgi:hypothetical protein